MHASIYPFMPEGLNQRLMHLIRLHNLGILQLIFIYRIFIAIYKII